jgi:CubicO group peptidase (beta-lactamase class C family)
MALDIVAWHDRPQSDHGEQLNKFAALGYRTLSLSVYDDPARPLYASVMIKRPVVIATEQRYGLTASQWQQTFDAMAARGMGPYIVTATGPAASAVYAAVFMAANPIPLTRTGITADEFRALNAQGNLDGLRLVWMDSFGTSDDIRYAAIWAPNPEAIAWNCDAVNEGSPAFQDRFNGMVQTWACPAHIAITPSGRGMGLYTDQILGPFEARTNLSSGQYQNLFDQKMAQGLTPLRVSAKGNGANARFAALFATRENGMPRTWSTSGPTTLQPIDDAMRNFMQDHGIRGGALSIVEETRLVYAKGYTLAEQGYPVVQPTTLFRQASCSKILVAMSLYRILQDRHLAQPGISIDQQLDKITLQSVLNLTQPNGTPPADQRLAEITLRHLLDSRSGLDQGTIWRSRDAASAASAPLPATRTQLARFAASLAMTGQPGDPNNCVYGNFDYFMLSEVVRVLMNSGNFEEALGKLVLQPLGVTRVRQSRSLFGVNHPDEARYHLTVYNKNNDDFLTVSPTIRNNSQALVATQYGGFDMEMFSGCGGLSAAVTDMARIAASLSVRNGNPVLASDTIDTWLRNAANTTAAVSKPEHHGFHGWDGVGLVDPVNHIFQGSKGGSLPGTGTGVIFRTGGLTLAAVFNSRGRGEVTTDWYQPVVQAAVAHDWGTVDLFPNFGMAPFAKHTVPLPPHLTRVSPHVFLPLGHFGMRPPQ